MGNVCANVHISILVIVVVPTVVYTEIFCLGNPCLIMLPNNLQKKGEILQIFSAPHLQSVPMKLSMIEI